MIDFCHVEFSDLMDENYLKGLEGLIQVLEAF